MRAILGGLAALAISTNAWSADMLRGSAPAFGEASSYSWAGIYFGAQGGIANADFEFGDATGPMIQNLLRQTLIENEFQISTFPSLPNRDKRGNSFGGFVGYNSQWGDVVLGAELNYSHTKMDTAVSEDFIGRRVTLSNDEVIDVGVTSRASAQLTDYGTLRLRAGYAYNWFMPYAMVGLAAGAADVSRSVTVTQFNATTPPGFDYATLAASESKTGVISIGYMAGLGVDIGLMPGVFVRAEYEFVQFADFDDIPVRVSTGRLALGIKF